MIVLWGLGAEDDEIEVEVIQTGNIGFDCIFQ
jgi:hypothetical protein